MSTSESLTSMSVSPMRWPNVEKAAAKRLPDVAHETTAPVAGKLDRVGMSGIEVMIRYGLPGEAALLPARADVYVDLTDPQAKGIHMSRLFLALQQQLDQHPFDLALSQQLLRQFLQSHDGLSSSSFLQMAFEHPQRRQALLSDNSAWRSYPVRVASQFADGHFRHLLQVRVTYSSACPCSTALTKQLLQEQFYREFEGNQWLTPSHVHSWLGAATTQIPVPHSQRSHADVTVQLAEGADTFPTGRLIDLIEAGLTTPVQAAVKREDEQEFARLNGENLMFCEDAARRLKTQLDRVGEAADYHIRCSHLESLHPHDAVAVVTKGIPGGMQPD